MGNIELKEKMLKIGFRLNEIASLCEEETLKKVNPLLKDIEQHICDIVDDYIKYRETLIAVQEEIQTVIQILEEG